MSAQRTRYTTEHADEMFRIRATAGAAVAPAWERGLRVDIPAEAPVPRHDEARYDARTDLVVFRREGTLTTCYGLDAEHITNIHGVAVAAATDAQFGTGYCSRLDPANLEDV